MTTKVLTKPEAVALAAAVKAAHRGVLRAEVKADKCVGFEVGFFVNVFSVRERAFLGSHLVASLEEADALADLPLVLVPRELRVANG